MNDPIIECFKNDFDRFWGLFVKQINLCPKELWAKKTGGYIFWQQQLHIVACTFLFAQPQGPGLKSVPYKPEILMLSEAADFDLEKEELLRLAQEALSAAHEFMGRQTVATLTLKHELMTNLLGREMTNQTALIALIRHLCYHLGSCDAALRDEGLAGVY